MATFQRPSERTNECPEMARALPNAIGRNRPCADFHLTGNRWTVRDPRSGHSNADSRVAALGWKSDRRTGSTSEMSQAIELLEAGTLAKGANCRIGFEHDLLIDGAASAGV